MALLSDEKWCSQSFNRLRSLVCAGGETRDTLQHFQSPTFDDMVLSFTQGYDNCVSKFVGKCIENGDPEMAWSFLEAQYDLYMRFKFGPFRMMAKKITMHILGSQEIDNGRTPFTPQPHPPPSPSSCSGPPTPCTIDDWVNEVRIEGGHMSDSPHTLLQVDLWPRAETQALISTCASTQTPTEAKFHRSKNRSPTQRRAPNPEETIPITSIPPKKPIQQRRHPKADQERREIRASITGARRITTSGRGKKRRQGQGDDTLVDSGNRNKRRRV